MFNSKISTKLGNIKSIISIIIFIILLIFVSIKVFAEEKAVNLNYLSDQISYYYLTYDSEDCYSVMLRNNKILVYDFKNEIKVYDNKLEDDYSQIYKCEKIGDYFYFGVKTVMEIKDNIDLSDMALKLYKTKDFKEYEYVKMLPGIPPIRDFILITKEENIFTRYFDEEYKLAAFVENEKRIYDLDFTVQSAKVFNDKIYFCDTKNIYMINSKNGELINKIKMPKECGPYQILNESLLVDYFGDVYKFDGENYIHTDLYKGLSYGKSSIFYEYNDYIYYIHDNNEICVYSKKLDKFETIKLNFDIDKVVFLNENAYFINVDMKDCYTVKVDLSEKINMLKREYEEKIKDELTEIEASNKPEKSNTSSDNKVNNKDKNKKDKDKNKDKNKEKNSDTDKINKSESLDSEKVEKDFKSYDKDPAKNKDYWYIPDLNKYDYKNSSLNPLIINYTRGIPLNPKIDYENGIIYNIYDNVTLDELIDVLKDDVVEYRVKNKKSKILSTGDYIVIKNGEKEQKLRIAVYGDINKNGAVTTRDAELIINYIDNNYDFSDDILLYYSANIKSDAEVDASDMVYIFQYAYYKLLN